jgi:sodium transport system permease protein
MTDTNQLNASAYGAAEHRAAKNSRLQWQLILKELRETLRDRRTIITLLAMPLMLYPLIGLVFRTMTLQQQQSSEQNYQIAVRTEEESKWLTGILEEYLKHRRAEQQLHPNVEFEQPMFSMMVPQDLTQFNMEEAVRLQMVELGVRISFSSEEKFKGFPVASIQILQTIGAQRSHDASRILKQALNTMRYDVVSGWIKDKDQEFHSPWDLTSEYIQPASMSSPFLGLIPLVLLLMTVTGGVYPAIDLTAGERERDTLETLISLPISTFRILVAKYVAVLTITLLTGVMNLLAMAITIYSLQLEKTLFGEQGVSPLLLFKLLGIQIVFGSFISALLLLVTSSARSFKEAQAYLVPILLLAMIPGLAIMLPGWHLVGVNVIIPLVNMLLLARDVAEGHAHILPGVVAMITTSLYTLLTLSLAGQIFGRDAFATGSRGMWSDLWTRPAQQSSTPQMTHVFQFLAVLFPLYFIASGGLSRLTDTSPTAKLLISGSLTLCLFVVLPAISMWYQRIVLSSGFAMRPFSLIYLPIVVLLGLTTWPLVYESVIFLHSNWLQNLLNEEQLQRVKLILESWKQVPLPLIVLCLGILPGVSEELFFRGFCYSGIRSILNSTWTILLTSLLFAAFHLLLSGGASPERFVPSLFMGLLLGYVRTCTNSIWPSTLLHTRSLAYAARL